MDKLLDIDRLYKELAKGMLKELFEYLEDKPITVRLGDTEVTIKINKIKVDEG